MYQQPMICCLDIQTIVAAKSVDIQLSALHTYIAPALLSVIGQELRYEQVRSYALLKFQQNTCTVCR